MKKIGQNSVGPNTRLAHAGNDPFDYFGFVNPPVVHASTVLFPNAQAMKDYTQPYTYGTRGTPTTDALAKATDEMEGSFGTVCLPSGLAAVTVPLMAFLSAGDHALIVDTIYAPTRRFADTFLKRMGVEVDYYQPEIGADIEKMIKNNTKVLFLESPASNTFEMTDVPLMARIASARGIITMIDNTYATPLHFRPLEHGVDISLSAATKYQAGHSDVLFGTVSANEKCWPQLRETQINTGICAQGDDAYQVLRGMRTMGVRLARHDKTARDLAAWMEGQNGVGQVMHPALPSFKGHDIWKRDFTGAAGIFSFTLQGGEEKHAHAFLDALTYFGLGYSWGGYESLAVPVNLGDRTVSARDYGGPVIRLQIGLEDFEDLKADIENGLAAARSI